MNAQRMIYWDGGKQRTLSKREELFMGLYRLRTEVREKEVARTFDISKSSFHIWIVSFAPYLRNKELSALIKFLTLKAVQRHMLESFRDFPNTRVILDCTEVRIQKPSKLNAPRQTFSPYKHYNTFKALEGVTPDGHVCFVPDFRGSHISDIEAVEKSGLVDLLEPGDAVMVDKGFCLDTILPPAVQIHIPFFKRGTQLSASEVIATRKIAGARFHVERVIRRIKEFHFLDTLMPVNTLHIAGCIFRTCALLCNFQGLIIS
ncbi:unnamed protein product, partial [Ixodes pacificus]